MVRERIRKIVRRDGTGTTKEQEAAEEEAAQSDQSRVSGRAAAREGSDTATAGASDGDGTADGRAGRAGERVREAARTGGSSDAADAGQRGDEPPTEPEDVAQRAGNLARVDREDPPGTSGSPAEQARDRGTTEPQAAERVRESKPPGGGGIDGREQPDTQTVRERIEQFTGPADPGAGGGGSTGGGTTAGPDTTGQPDITGPQGQPPNGGGTGGGAAGEERIEEFASDPRPDTDSADDSTTDLKPEEDKIGVATGPNAAQIADLEEEYGVNLGENSVTEFGTLTGRGRQRIAAAQFDERFPEMDIRTGDTRPAREGRGFVLTEAARRQLQAAQVSEQVGAELTPQQIEETESGIELSPSGQRAATAAAVSEQRGVDITAEQIVGEPGSFRLSETAAESIRFPAEGAGAAVADTGRMAAGRGLVDVARRSGALQSRELNVASSRAVGGPQRAAGGRRILDAARRTGQRGAQSRAARGGPVTFVGGGPTDIEQRVAASVATTTQPTAARAGGQVSGGQGPVSVAETPNSEVRREFLYEPTRQYLRWKRQQAAAGVSPLVSMAIPEGKYQTAAAGERRIFQAAQRGNNAATVYTGGELIQLVGRDVGQAVEEGLPLEGIPVVGEPAESAAAGIVEFPFTLAGGTAQAVSAPYVPGVDLERGEFTEQTTEGITTGTVRTGQYAAANPIEAGLILATPYTIRGGARAVRSVRSGTVGRRTIPVERLTTERGARGEIPRFETSPRARTVRAVSEVRTRAGDVPRSLAEATDTGRVLFHTTAERFGGRFTVGEGASELPGLFTSPELNPVGLRSTQFGARARSIGASLRPRLPKTKSDRALAFEAERVRGMPETARGAGYELRRPSGEIVEQGLGRGQAKARAADTDLVVRPQSNTGGYRFLTEEAAPGTAYVRPRGSRTTELEAIYPPESQFTQTGGRGFAVRVGGRRLSVPFSDRTISVGGERIPLEVYKRVATGRPSARGTTAADTGTVGGGNLARSYTPLSEVGPRTGTPVSAYLSGTAAATASTSTTTAAATNPAVTDTTTAGSGSGVASSLAASAPASTAASGATGVPSGLGGSTASTAPGVSTGTGVDTSLRLDVSLGSTGPPTDTPRTPTGREYELIPALTPTPTTTPSDTPSPPTTPPSTPGTPSVPFVPPTPPTPPSTPRGGDEDPLDVDGDVFETIEDTAAPEEGPLGAGWLSETITDIALGAQTDIQPTQSQLEAAPSVLALSGNLPTRQFYTDDEDRARIRDVQRLLGGF